jgi:hypothetical protein
MTNETQPQDTTYSIVASPDFAQDGVCFAARASGLYRSEDGGANWRSAYDSLRLKAPLLTRAVAVSPGFGSDRCVYAGVSGGVLRSCDGGQSWRVTTLPSPPPLVCSLVISPNFGRDGLLLAGTWQDGVFRSANRGNHWTAWNFGLLDRNVYCMALSPQFARDEALFVGVQSGVFGSTNGGRAWRVVNFPAELAPVHCLALSPRFGDDGVMFAGTRSHGLHRSNNRGHSWTRLGPDAFPGRVNAVILSPNFPHQAHLLAARGDALLLSRNDGAAWDDWETEADFTAGLACVAAPGGLECGAPLLVGMAEGGVWQV